MKILVIQLKRIGDLILSAPVIAALREKFPNGTIHLAISGACRDLRPAIRGVDRFVIGKGGWSDIPDWLVVLTTGYDYCLDLTRTDRSALMAFLSRAKKKITYQRTKARSKWRARIYNHFIDSAVRQSHTVDHHLAFLKPLGIHDASGAIKLHLPPDAIRRASKILSSEAIDIPMVIFHPGSARQEKFWEAERWAAVINHCCSRRDIACVLTSGNTALEKSHIAAIKGHLQHRVTDISGKTDLLALMALIARARLLVSIDSAPPHLAAAMGTPQIVLYGPTNSFHWRPRFSPAVILQAGIDHPLSEFSPHQPRVGMNQISTQQVIDAMEALLSAPAAFVA